MLPVGGDAVSREIAEVLHRAVVAFRSSQRAASGAAIARRFGFSRQTWSDVIRGRRWPGHTVLVALIAAHHDAMRSNSNPGS